MASAWALVALVGLVVGCGAPPVDPPRPAASEGSSWSVTAWGSHFEVFPEVAPLVAGEASRAVVHVTRLEDFAPLVEGRVELVLAGAEGDSAFAAGRALRPGVFEVEVRPRAAGDHALSFRIAEGQRAEEIRGGRVRVGTAGEPGRLLVAPAPRAGTDGVEPSSFLKEEQWRSDFATAWVRRASLPGSVEGLARVLPPAGGERTLTAAVDGVVEAPPGAGFGPWPYVGMKVARGSTLFRLVPRTAPEKSLAALEGDVAALSAQLRTARLRHARLEELWSLEATSQRELEESRSRVESLEARREASRQDLGAARASRSRDTGVPGSRVAGLGVRSPLAGEVAQVLASPGATVAAGQALARIVRTDRVWIELAATPEGAARLGAGPIRGLLLRDSERPPWRLERGVRLVSISPEVSPRTGTRGVFVEAPRPADLALGSVLEGQILTDDETPGIVIPGTALVDDGGVSVVYLQLSGERFVRQRVEVVERQGDRLRVTGLVAGQRLVERGGEVIRRASLVASGGGHGHAH